MNCFEKNQKKLDEFVKAFASDDESAFHKEINEYINQLSYNIGDAINPVNELAIPFVVYALEYYANELKKGREEYVDYVVKGIKEEFKTAVITIPGKRRAKQ